MMDLGLIVPASLRASLRTTMLEQGVPAHAVDEIADLSTLAVTDAFEAIERVISRSSTNAVQITALSVTIGTAEALLRTHAEALAATARASGMHITEGMVSIGEER